MDEFCQLQIQQAPAAPYNISQHTKQLLINLSCDSHTMIYACHMCSWKVYETRCGELTTAICSRHCSCHTITMATKHAQWLLGFWTPTYSSCHNLLSSMVCQVVSAAAAAAAADRAYLSKSDRQLQPIAEARVMQWQHLTRLPLRCYVRFQPVYSL